MALASPDTAPHDKPSKNAGFGITTHYLIRLVIIYTVLHFLLDMLANYAHNSDTISLWYPTDGLILNTIWQFRLIGAALSIVTGLAGYYVFGPSEIGILDAAAEIFLLAFLGLIARSILRRLGLLHARTTPRPQLALAYLIAAVVITFCTSLLGVSQLAHVHMLGTEPFFIAFFKWWLGDLNGVVGTAMFIFFCVFPFMTDKVQLSIAGIKKWLPRIIGYGLFAFLPVWISLFGGGALGLRVVFLVAIPVAYAAMRRGSIETGIAIFAANVAFMFTVKIEGTARGLELQILDLLISAGGIIVSALSSYQRDMLRALQKTLNERDALMENKIRIEKQLAETRKLEALGELAGGMAHELNNLLHPINTFARAAVDAEPDARQHYLGRIRDCVKSATGIVSDVLSFARAEHADERLPETLHHAKTSITNAADVAAAAISKTIQITEHTTLADENIIISPSRLIQVFLNVYRNAADAMSGKDDNTAQISVQSQVVNMSGDQAHMLGLAGGDYVLISVADSGTGMSEDVRAHAFEPFFTTKAIGRGTGLGLAAVYGILKSWKGAIAVDNSSIGGACIRLYIPIAARDV